MGAPLQDLPKRLQALEEEAFLEFARTFRGRFFRFFLEHGLPSFEAEDLAASLVTDILLKIDRYQPREGVAFSAWVNQLMRNTAIDWLRSKARTPSPRDLLDAAVPAAAPDPESLAAVHEALETLNDEDRLIVEMRNVDDEHTYSEIGALLGITTGAARIRHFRALRKLAQVLTQDHRIRLRLPGCSAIQVSEEEI